jgi:hypothetical protein
VGTVHAEEKLPPLLQLHAVERESVVGACETEGPGYAGDARRWEGHAGGGEA